MDNINFVGLDVHKATVCVAVAENGRDDEVRQVGVFDNRPDVLNSMVSRLGKKGRRLSFCYEAGPCGYGLQRLLTDAGHECVVVAPSLIPIKAGDRVKTDRRDATMLAKLHRAGELTAIWFPIRRMRRCATWFGRARPPSGFWARRGSTYKGSCFAMSGFIKDLEPGRWLTGAG